MTTSGADDMPRDASFRLSRNRLNVAISHARCLAVLVASPGRLDLVANSVDEMRLANLFCWAAEFGQRRWILTSLGESHQLLKVTGRTSKPSALAECRKINTRRGIPSRRAIAGAKLHRDVLVAIRNPQRSPGYRVWLGGSRRTGIGASFAFPSFLCRPRRLRRC